MRTKSLTKDNETLNVPSQSAPQQAQSGHTRTSRRRTQALLTTLLTVKNEHIHTLSEGHRTQRSGKILARFLGLLLCHQVAWGQQDLSTCTYTLIPGLTCRRSASHFGQSWDEQSQLDILVSALTPGMWPFCARFHRS